MIRPITKEALELIEHFEGFYPKPYLDPVGIPTIGIGTIAYEVGIDEKTVRSKLTSLEKKNGKYVDPRLKDCANEKEALAEIAKVRIDDFEITHERAYQLLMFELTEKADTIHTFLKKSAVLLSDQQYSALVSFAYNCGCGPIIDSGRSLHEAIKSDNPIKIADAFLIYNKGTKKFGPFKRVVELPGLTRRRKAERYLFLNGVNNFFEA